MILPALSHKRIVLFVLCFELCLTLLSLLPNPGIYVWLRRLIIPVIFPGLALAFGIAIDSSLLVGMSRTASGILLLIIEFVVNSLVLLFTLYLIFAIYKGFRLAFNRN